MSPAMIAAITRSDNDSAEQVWESLGDPVTAAGKVQAVLSQAGDPTVVQSQRIRPEFTAFGQTEWSLSNQVHFLSQAACDAANAPVLDLMGQIEADQRWGLGGIPGAQFKGGWGPDANGKYLVRQLGVIPAGNGKVAVAIAAAPASGAFGDGTHTLDTMTQWISSHLDQMPSGTCS